MTHSFPGFMTEKMARKLSGLVIYLYLKDGAFTTVRGTICQQKVYEMGTFQSKMVYKQGKGLDLGAEYPRRGD